ncbi:hypothetical protein SNE40_023747 [Patella caerulea]|uniref:DUF5641 domain-containing protein n=1 Tax=Patella caerulea TaxID=87958 RepID=A0AAN8GER2_PATCE
MIEGFWSRWMNNIQKLSPRDKWTNTRENLNRPNGDIVLVVDENVKRGKWKLAEIINTYTGDDNLVRIVDVKFSDGNVLKRPVTKLVLLMKNEERLDL